MEDKEHQIALTETYVEYLVINQEKNAKIHFPQENKLTALFYF